MKKKYIFIIIILLLILISIILLINNKKTGKVESLTKFHYSFNKGNSSNSYANYKIECNKNCYISIKPYNYPDNALKEYDLDNKTIKKIIKILNKYNITSWNNYKKYDKKVLDGNGFDLYVIYNDSKKIDASGYMKYPNHYKSFEKEIVKLLDKTYSSDDIDISFKPIIYLYPTKTINVSIKLGYKEKILVSYPEYNDGWNVLASPNGDLIDINTNRKLYALYWEGLNTVSKKEIDEGFIVKGEDTITFLEEKLKILGLNERESEEFIIYWLPKLINNKYNYIRFETIEEQNKNMPLIINPMPDTIIRVNMEFKQLDKYINIKEQELISVKRTGFTVVEWGGTLIN